MIEAATRIALTRIEKTGWLVIQIPVKMNDPDKPFHAALRG